MKTFRRALQDARISLTAELPLPPAGGVETCLAKARELAGPVDAIQLRPAAGDRPSVSALALSSLLIREGIDPVPLLHCRDRNRIALQSDLLGLRAMGVSSFLAAADDRPTGQGATAGTPVFDVRATELIAMAGALNEENWGDGRHEFIAGVGAATDDPPAEGRIAEIREQAAAGARFLRLRHRGGGGALHGWLQALVASRLTWRYSVIVSLPCPEGGGAGDWADRIRTIAALPGISGISLPVTDDTRLVLDAIDGSGCAAP